MTEPSETSDWRWPPLDIPGDCERCNGWHADDACGQPPSDTHVNAADSGRSTSE